MFLDAICRIRLALICAPFLLRSQSLKFSYLLYQSKDLCSASNCFIKASHDVASGTNSVTGSSQITSGTGSATTSTRSSRPESMSHVQHLAGKWIPSLRR